MSAQLQTFLTPRQVKRTVDKLADLQLQLAELNALVGALKKQQSDLETLLEAGGVGEYFGSTKKFRVLEVITSRINLDRAKALLTAGQIIDCTVTTTAIAGKLVKL